MPRKGDRTLIRLFIINILRYSHFAKAVPKAVLSHKKYFVDLACELGAKPVPLVPDRFIAYIHSTFMKQVFKNSHWLWKSRIKHYCTLDEFRTGFEVAAGKLIRHSRIAACQIYCGHGGLFQSLNATTGKFFYKVRLSFYRFAA